MLIIDGEEVPVRRRMKYLGLIIDSEWTFVPHFEHLVPRVTAAANALCGLQPNIGGAGLGVRRLYEGVVRSRVLYGAPVWAEDLSASRRSLILVRRLHRTTAIRIARGYRTVSYAAATVLAASPPALALRRVYEHRRAWSRTGVRRRRRPPWTSGKKRSWRPGSGGWKRIPCDRIGLFAPTVSTGRSGGIEAGSR